MNLIFLTALRFRVIYIGHIYLCSVKYTGMIVAVQGSWTLYI